MTQQGKTTDGNVQNFTMGWLLREASKHNLNAEQFFDVVNKMTLEEASSTLAQRYPNIWKRMNTKFIDAPGSHYGFKYVATMTSSSIAFAEPENANFALIASLLEKFNFPVYYVSGPLVDAMQRTHPPSQMTWADLVLPYEALVFMVPIEKLKSSEPGHIGMVGVARFPKDTDIAIPVVGKRVVMNKDEDRISVFWTSAAGLVTDDCTFPVSQKLEVDVDWIESHTAPEDAGMFSSNFSSFMSGLVANLLLVMQARPEIVERGESQRKVLKSGLRVYSPNFIGRKYQIARKERLAAQGKFTELGWRAGHMKRQHHGPNNTLEKIIFIDPYIAFTHSLARRET